MGGAVMIGAVVVCLVVIPLVGSWYTSPRRLREKSQRAIEGQKTSPIAALKEGERVKIRGVVAAREPLLTSPIGGHACIGYNATIEEPHDTWAAQVVSRERWLPFLVTDETGTIAVEGQFELLVGPGEVGLDLTPSALALLEESNTRMKDLWGARRFSFRETVLKVGDRISVVGRPSRASGAGAGSSEGPQPTYVMYGTYAEPVVVMDDLEPIGLLPAGPPPAVPQLSEAPSVRGPSRREIERRATTATAALREGEPARIQGVAGAREPLLTSPVDGRSCIGYQVVIERLPRGDVVVRRESWPSFLVTDDTGTAVAEGPFAILLDPDDAGWAALPPSVYSLLEEARVPVVDVFGRDEEFRFKETLLAPGDRVSVFGRPAREIDPAGRGSFREPPRLFVLRGSEQDPVAVIDDDEPVAG